MALLHEGRNLNSQFQFQFQVWSDISYIIIIVPNAMQKYPIPSGFVSNLKPPEAAKILLLLYFHLITEGTIETSIITPETKKIK